MLVEVVRAVAVGADGVFHDGPAVRPRPAQPLVVEFLHLGRVLVVLQAVFGPALARRVTRRIGAHFPHFGSSEEQVGLGHQHLVVHVLDGRPVTLVARNVHLQVGHRDVLGFQRGVTDVALAVAAGILGGGLSGFLCYRNGQRRGQTDHDGHGDNECHSPANIRAHNYSPTVWKRPTAARLRKDRVAPHRQRGLTFFERTTRSPSHAARRTPRAGWPSARR